MIHNSYDVAGFNNELHLRSLGEFVQRIPPCSRVLEIGVGFGGSTWELLDSLPVDCELHSCDTFGMDSLKLKRLHKEGILKKHYSNESIVRQMDIYVEQGQRAAFDWAINQHPRRADLKEVHACKSLDLLRTDVRWDCVYIDGLHSYENVWAELILLRKVNHLCGDDYHPVHPGCMHAIDEVVASDLTRSFWHDTPDSRSGFWYSIKEGAP